MKLLNKTAKKIEGFFYSGFDILFVVPTPTDEYDRLALFLGKFKKGKLEIIGQLDNGTDSVSLLGEGWHCDYEDGIAEYWMTNKESKIVSLEISALETAFVSAKNKMIIQVIKDYEDIMTFGKHKGKTVDWIAENEPSYIVWLVEKNVVECDEEIFDAAYIDYRNPEPPEEWFYISD